MKKENNTIKLISFIITVIFILCGCIQQEKSENITTVFGEIDKIELINYSVSTISSTGEKLADNFTYIDGMFGYKVSGIVKSIHEYYISKLQINAHFYDINGNLLNTYEDAIYGLEKQYQIEFNIYFLDSTNFKYIDNVKFEFITF